MSDFVWYSRLAVWAGAAVLLVQAVTGRSAGLVTVLAVLILTGGFVAFLAGLMWSGRPERALVLVTGGQQTADVTEPTGAVRASGATEVVAAPADREEVRPAPMPRGTVYAAEVEIGSPDVGVDCPGCGRRMTVGDVVVRCFSCETLQHAACWTQNHLHCAAPGCPARGGVEAPD